MQTGQASLTDTASQVAFSCLMVSLSLLGHGHRKQLQSPSSGESELYAMSVGAAEALGLRELFTDIGLPTTVRLRCDSTAAMGTATRQGLGRMKTRAGTRSCFATMDCRWPFDPTKDCELCKCCRPSHETCVTECTPVSRPETWSSTVTIEATRLLECCIGMWTDGRRNGTPVYWLDFVTIGMRLLSAMCSVRHERSAL